MNYQSFAIIVVIILFSCQSESKENSGKNSFQPASDPRITAFKAKLAQLDSASLQSIPQAIEFFYQNFDKKPSELNDYAIALFKQFHQDILLYNQDAIVMFEPNRESLVLDKLNKSLSEYGYQVRITEGQITPFIDAKFYISKFSSFMSENERYFEEKLAQETRQPIIEDDAIVLPIAEIAKRIAWREQFLSRKPDFCQKAQIEDSINQLMYLLLQGTDNTPAFSYGSEYEARMLNDEFKNAYSEIIRNYAELPVGKVIGEYTALLERSGYRLTDEVLQFIEKYNTKNF